MPGNLVIQPLIQSGLVPGVAALLAGTLVHLILRAIGRPREKTGLITAISLAAGYLAGDFALRGALKTPPTEASQWLPWLAIACLVIMLLSKAFARHRGLAWALAILTISTAAILTLRPLLQHTWKGNQAILYPTIIVAILILNFVMMVFVSSRSPRIIMHAIVLMQTLAAAVLLGATGSALLAQLTGSLVAGATACLILAWRIPTSFVGISTSMTVTTLLGCLMLNGHFYSETPAWSASTVLFAPITALVTRLGPVRRWRPASQTTFSLIAVALCLGAALGYTILATPTPEPYRP